MMMMKMRDDGGVDYDFERYDVMVDVISDES